MISIYTKYLPATDRRGAHIKAYTCAGKESLTRPLDYDLNEVERHATVARAFINQYLPGCVDMPLTYGDAPKGFVFTFAASKVEEAA